MALVKCGVHITNVKGKINNNYFQRGRFGTHIKACPRRVKSQNATLQITHNIFTTVQNAWKKKVWSISEVSKWNAYNKRHPSLNAFGDRITLTHQLSFIKFNLYQVRNELPIIYDPPREIV